MIRRTLKTENCPRAFADISVSELAFKCSDNSTVLTDGNCKIPAGKIIAIIGPTGSGKSTLMELLPGLRQPLSGRIELGKTYLSHVKLEEVFRHISFSPQAPDVFHGNPVRHIYCGNESFSKKK